MGKTVSTRKTRISTPHVDPSNGQTYPVPIDIELAIRRAAVEEWITPQRVEAAMNKVANLAVEAYEPTISQLTAALLDPQP